MGKKTEARESAEVSAVAVRGQGPEHGAAPDAADPPRKVDLAKVVHLLRRAVLTLHEQDPLGIALREVVEMALSMGDPGVRVEKSSWDRVRLVADALALDPHAESAHRDVRAAMDVLGG